MCLACPRARSVLVPRNAAVLCLTESGVQFDVTKVGKHNFGGVTIEVSASIMWL
jgi:hypothetical protein